MTPRYDYDTLTSLLRVAGRRTEGRRVRRRRFKKTGGRIRGGFFIYEGITSWPNRDPIAEKGGVNLYAMVGNRAVDRWDVLGLADTNGLLLSKDKWQAQLNYDIEKGNVLSAIRDFCACVTYGFSGSYAQAVKEMNPLDKDSAIRECGKRMLEPDPENEFPNNSGKPDEQCGWCISGNWQGTLNGGFSGGLTTAGGIFKGTVSCTHPKNLSAEVTAVVGGLGVFAAGGGSYVGQMNVKLNGAKTAADLKGKRFASFAAAFMYKIKGRDFGGGGGYGPSGLGFGVGYGTYFLWMPGTIQ